MDTFSTQIKEAFVGSFSTDIEGTTHLYQVPDSHLYPMLAFMSQDVLDAVASGDIREIDVVYSYSSVNGHIETGPETLLFLTKNGLVSLAFISIGIPAELPAGKLTLQIAIRLNRPVTFTVGIVQFSAIIVARDDGF